METEREYRDEFVERVRLARVACNLNQEQMATALGIKQNTYSRYEGGRGGGKPTLMPHPMMVRFCIICRISEGWLLSGKGEGPRVARPTKRSEVA
jgi:transcriptional regulator with XRE-family HTH domain